MRTFESGATRDDDCDKLDFDGFLSPLALRRFAEYMHKHRVQADGKLRESDNWQRAIPQSAYMKSAWRHFMTWWEQHWAEENLAPASDEELEEALCALLFNVQGYLHELLKRKRA